MNDITLTLNNPLSEEDWDKITDVDMEHTSRVWFNTKNGKKVEFVKPKQGKWINKGFEPVRCSECGATSDGYNQIAWADINYNFCPNCGADMRGEETWNG